MDFPLPPVGEGLIEVELVRWLVRPGDAVARGQGLAEVMSDKATMEVPSPFAGTVSTLAATPGTKVKVGELFLTEESIWDVATPPAPSRQASGRLEPAVPVAQKEQPAHASRSPVLTHSPANGPAVAPGHPPAAAPSVRLLARKLGIEL